jgi:hypothetical protein
MMSTRSQVISISGRMCAGDDDGHPAAQAGDEVAHDEDLVRVEADGRLVHDDDGRLGEDGLGDADALAVALGELADDLVADALQVAELEHLVDARAELAARDLLQPAAEVEVFAHAHVLGQRVVLRHVADAALDLVGCVATGTPQMRTLPEVAGR